MTTQNRYKSYEQEKTALACPVCKSTEYYGEGEYVDIGVGYQKCSPDWCEQCGYIESGGYINSLPFEYYKQRWETKVDPLPPKPKLTKGPLPEEYQIYIDSLTKNPYGRCKEETKAMKQVFPHLETVYGYYHCPIWGSRRHFFLYDPTRNNLIVDPTAKQFPSGGAFTYTIDYPIDINTLKRTDFPTDIGLFNGDLNFKLDIT